MVIKYKRVQCFKCGRKFDVQLPTWITEVEILSCPICGSDVRVYPWKYSGEV